MNAIIVDDEAHNIENLQGILSRGFPAITVLGTAATINAAAALITAQTPDLVFLDIQMGKETGFDLLKRLPERGFEVIFVTAYDQYGIQAIKFAALDYILKPIDENELKAAIEGAVEKWSRKQSYQQLNFLINHLKGTGKAPAKIALPLFQETRYVAVDSIVRCEAQNTYVYFYLNNGEKILVSRPLKEYDELLAPGGFIRCHQTHLVNPVFIKSLLKEDGGCLLLTNEEKIPVSKAKRDAVKRALAG
ncbi:LytR/AlgR family response regulator transcription factor [Niabella drilacis]|uniref:Two component transcriptional regulator, LytTR family n=1 Tax=Niabella drilacis (strain DSM 25811 / CCM 8410 / CCUG 62505 / LMG 26954 / E90) TaxID=1285928 RepID=A0A1G6YRL5_NIADE|nr:LytTR family DNA-binding domain-containing protein [Niabella drilacis]SDD92307.1 two component transcriptional regulator, LytTR family [Niabella drilacis]